MTEEPSNLKFTEHPLSVNPASFGNPVMTSTLQREVTFLPDHLHRTAASGAVTKVKSKHLMHLKNGKFWLIHIIRK